MMAEFCGLRLRQALGWLVKHCSRPICSLARARSSAALCLLAAALASGAWAARGPAWSGGSAQAVESASGLSLSPSSRVTYPGATFTVDILVDCGSNADAAATVVTFDPAHLQVEALTPDLSAFATTLLQGYDNVAGQVRYDAGSLTCHAASNCPSGSVRLATIRFRTIGECGFLVPLALKGQIAWEGLLTFDGVGAGSTVAITIAGDVDADGAVDVVDIMLVAGRWSAVQGQPQYDPGYDLDSNGEINLMDITFVAARWNTTCPGGAPLAGEVR